MLASRSVSKRFSHYLQPSIICISQTFCTTSNNDSQSSNHSDTNFNSNWIEAPTLPCFFSQFDAMETFNLWAKRQWFAPKAFRKDTDKYVHVIHKYYVPYWHFEAYARSRWHASTSPDTPPTKEHVTSCTYSSSQPEMQIIATDRLTEDESRFLSIPLGPTQFQRMHHHIEDVLPDIVNVCGFMF